LPQPVGIALRPPGNGVGDVAVAENVGVMPKVSLERLGSHWVHGKRLCGQLERVCPHQSLQTLLKLGLRLGLDLVVILLVARSGPLAEDEDALSMDPIRGPIGSHITAVSPNRTDLHAAHRLPDVLSLADVAVREDRLAVRGGNPIGNGWCLLVDAGADPAEDGK
jgi:hypothetical protein